MPQISYSDEDAVQALLRVVGDSRWDAVAIAHGFHRIAESASDEEAAREIYGRGAQTLRKSRMLIEQLKATGFISLLLPRQRVGSAENPITKLFPATITEQRFIELLDELCESREGISYSDDRESGHSLTDFTILEGELNLRINIKNAGTRFERAQQLVGLDPDDSIPIPAYKAHAAIEAQPNLLYVVSVDYELIKQLNDLLPQLFSRDELIVWDILNRFGGAHLRSGEDTFIFSMVRKYWDTLKQIVQNNPFHVISARKAIRILQTKPHRTPGIGLRAWGTAASAEVNVHVSIREDTTPWSVVNERIIRNGLANIIGAVNRKRVEEVYDPEI